jgi:hypothetical protein
VQVCGPRGDRWIAATGIGDTNTKPQPRQPVPGGKVSEHRPRFQLASTFGISLAAPRYCGVAIARGSKKFRWWSTQNESTRLATAVRQFARTKAVGE